MAQVSREHIARSLRSLQDSICEEIEKIDPRECFSEDLWKRKAGGGGRTRILEGGEVIEKGGVNFSSIEGELTKELAKALHIKADSFYATGLSIVLHPVNPYVPIIHMNVRYFELSNGTEWFGGGIDLTPHYVLPREAATFHRSLEKICASHAEVADYARFKKWADTYFYLPHRQETRGIGGIFFDRLSEQKRSTRWEFVEDLATSFIPIYEPLLLANKDKTYGKRERNWQLLRRGRYVEFNLIHDAGTTFGLQSGGRTESIFMSLPPQASWTYNFVAESGSAEAKTQELLQQGINWTAK